MQAETREEKLLTAISNGEKSGIVPYTRQEKFLSYIAGETDEKPTPITRIEMFLDKIERGGGGGDGTAVIRPLTVTENGTYIPPAGTDGYAPINVNIPEKTPILEQKHIIKNGFHAPSEGYDGIGIAWVEVEPITESIAVTENGTYTPADGVDGFSEVKVEVQSSGGSDKFVQLVNGTLTEVNDDSITEVRASAFQRSNIESVNLPNVTKIGESSFNSCGKLHTVNMPNVTELGVSSFRGSQPGTANMINNEITEISFPKVTSIPDSCFFACRKLSSYYLPNVAAIGSNAFAYTSDLKIADFQNVTLSIGDRAFQSSGIEKAYFHEFHGALLGTFYFCRSLTEVKTPKAASISNEAFYNCSALEKLDFPSVKKIASTSAFYGASKLKTLIFRYADSVCTLANVNNFTNTPFAANGTGGICLIPSALKESYEAATNWSTLYTAGTCLFWALEDYTVDGTTTGEIDWDKLNADREGAFETA